MSKIIGKGNIAVFIDAANILYSQQSLGWQVDYKKIADYFKKNYTTIFIGFYYGRIKENQGQQNFFSMLRDRGFTLRTKPVKHIRSKNGMILKGNLDVELTLDMSQLSEQYDCAVLLSGDSDFEALVQFVRNKGKRVVVVSSRWHVAKELIRAAHVYIPLEKLRKEWERKIK